MTNQPTPPDNTPGSNHPSDSDNPKRAHNPNGSDGTATRSIRVPILTRVEGEGALNIELHGPSVHRVELNIYEPPRFFEALLKGRSIHEVADITSRICGICPIAYQVTAAQAIEQALGITLPYELAALRRLIYCAEWIESHVLHIHLLHAPDFFECHSAVDLAKKFPLEVQRGLKLKQLGNRILEVLGGRAIHPINIAIGGFYRLPSHNDLSALIPAIEQGLSWAVDASQWIATLPFPNQSFPYDFVSLAHPEHYPIEDGYIATDSPDTTGNSIIAVKDYESHFREVQVPHSTALQSRRIHAHQPTNASTVARETTTPTTDSNYFVGPLARLHNNRQNLSPIARKLADTLRLDTSQRNPYHSILARAIEVVFAFEEALRILRALHPTRTPKIDFTLRAGVGYSATEAPRGLIFHRYEFDDLGRVLFAKIVPPTSQNQGQIEADLRTLVSQIHSEQDLFIAKSCEQLVRNYDPCISCSTHFMKVHIHRR